MGGMPVDICKVSILKRVDELSRNPAKRDAFLASLEDRTKDLATILVEHQALQRGDEEQHYRNHWFNENGQGWWRNTEHQPAIQNILREGLLQAFQEAKAHNVPVDSYWICMGNQFAMYITRSSQQVTRIILTPSIPAELMAAVQAAAARESPGGPAPIWVVNRGGTVQVPEPS
jgi:hypothetical protein